MSSETAAFAALALAVLVMVLGAAICLGRGLDEQARDEDEHDEGEEPGGDLDRGPLS